MMLKPLALVAPLLLMACTLEVPVSDSPAPEDQCGAAALQGLVGQPRSILDTMRFTEGTRIIEPGSAVTMDYRPDRLNILIGEDGLIEAVNCT